MVRMVPVFKFISKEEINLKSCSKAISTNSKVLLEQISSTSFKFTACEQNKVDIVNNVNGVIESNPPIKQISQSYLSPTKAAINTYIKDSVVIDVVEENKCIQVSAKLNSII